MTSGLVHIAAVLFLRHSGREIHPFVLLFLVPAFCKILPFAILLRARVKFLAELCSNPELNWKSGTPQN